MKLLSFTLLFIVIVSPITKSQWNFQNSGVYTNLYSSFFLDRSNGWISGASGAILKTTDGGTTWTQKPSGTSVSLAAIFFFDLNEGIVLGSNGTIKKSTDGGENWFTVNSGTGLRLLRCTFINSEQGWASGDNGIVIITTDGGDTWETQTFVTADNLNYIQFIDENTGWVTSENNGEIWKTTDGGNSWSYKYETPNDWNLWKLQFVNYSIGWAVGEWGLILKTIDGGESWFEQTPASSEGYFGLFFYGSDNGFIVGKDENIARTTNGGNNWNLDRSGSTFELYSIFFVDNNYGWIVGSSGTILFTDNWGGFPFNISPISILTPNGGEVLTAGSTYFIEWSSQNVADVKIEYSTDNGVSWITVIDSISSTGIYGWTVPNSLTTEGRVKVSDITNPDSFDISDGSFTIQSSHIITVVSPNGGEIIEGSSQYEILWSSEDVEYVKLEYSINNGATWDQIIDSTQSTGIYLWDVPNILTTQARIKISDLSLPSISDISDDPFRINFVVGVQENYIITDYKLTQNYPNPFNPTTIIKYQIPEISFVTLKIYDALGNEVASLVNEEKPAGNFEIEFSATDLSSGIYYYKLVAGDFVDVKKMLLLK